MHIDYFIDAFKAHPENISIIWKETSYNYEWLLGKIKYFQEYLRTNSISAGMVVGIQGDFSPNCIALMMALIENANIIVPFADAALSGLEKKQSIAQIEALISLDNNDDVAIQRLQRQADHPYYSLIREENEPGLVLFTSGTSGEPKAAVHIFSRLLKKFKTKRAALKTVNFLLFDHWGGLNTLFHTLSNVGVVLAIKERTPDAICQFIEKHKIELLPASPTFLNLLLISEAYRRYDLSSLKLITYGTEPMLESTLARLNKVFPEIKIHQTYGLIELGVLRAKSKSDDSLWVKVGGDGYDLRIRDGLLQIKAESAMLGYLNAASPYTEDGYFMTGDAVESEGEYIKILGRKSEIINVGGDKVYPAEVESIIHEMDNIAEVIVSGEKNLIVGMIVCAKVRLWHEENHREFSNKLKKHCSAKMQKFMVPVKITFTNESQFNERFKKKRLN